MRDIEDWAHTRPLRRGQAWVQRDGEETAVYNEGSGQLHIVNASALAIWELCDGETTPKEMAEAISELTGLGLEASAADVHRALLRLADAGLIEKI